MKIVITGGRGFIGNYVVGHFKNKHDLYILGRDNSSSNQFDPGISYYKTDYSFRSLDNIFKIIEPDSVIHLAALRPSENLNIYEYLLNLEISTVLFEVCLKHQVCNIINISSKSVYSHKDRIPWKEDTDTNPANGYGLSKKLVENSAEFFNFKGLNVKTLRIAQVIGYGERQGYVLHTFLSNAINHKPLYVYGKGRGRRHYIYVKDVVTAIEKSLNNSNAAGIFNIGMEKNYSFLQLAKTINKVFQNRAGIKLIEDQPADERVRLMSITKAEKELNWKPSFDLEDAFFNIKKIIDEGGNIFQVTYS